MKTTFSVPSKGKKIVIEVTETPHSPVGKAHWQVRLEDIKTGKSLQTLDGKYEVDLATATRVAGEIIAKNEAGFSKNNVEYAKTVV